MKHPVLAAAALALMTHGSISTSPAEAKGIDGPIVVALADPLRPVGPPPMTLFITVSA